MALGFLKKFLPSWEKAANDVLSTYIQALDLGIRTARDPSEDYDMNELLKVIHTIVFLQTVERLQPKTQSQIQLLEEISSILDGLSGVEDHQVQTAIRCHAWYTSFWTAGGYHDSNHHLDDWTIESCSNYGKWRETRRIALELSGERK